MSWDIARLSTVTLAGEELAGAVAPGHSTRAVPSGELENSGRFWETNGGTGGGSDPRAAPLLEGRTGATARRPGVTAFEAADAGPVATPFVAVTVKV